MQAPAFLLSADPDSRLSRMKAEGFAVVAILATGPPVAVDTAEMMCTTAFCMGRPVAATTAGRVSRSPHTPAGRGVQNVVTDGR